MASCIWSLKNKTDLQINKHAPVQQQDCNCHNVDTEILECQLRNALNGVGTEVLDC